MTDVSPADSERDPHFGKVFLGGTYEDGVMTERWGEPSQLPESAPQIASMETRLNAEMARSILSGRMPMPDYIPEQAWQMILAEQDRRV